MSASTIDEVILELRSYILQKYPVTRPPLCLLNVEEFLLGIKELSCENGDRDG